MLNAAALDPVRFNKRWNDRLIGTMRLVLGQGLCPEHFAEGAKAALCYLSAQSDMADHAQALAEIWKENQTTSADELSDIREILVDEQMVVN